MKTKHLLIVRGTSHEWAFEVDVESRYVAEWREDGLEINEIANAVPMWVANHGLTRPWCFVQDVFRFRNPF